MLTYIQRPYLHEGRRKGEEEEEGEGEVRFAFVRVARLRKGVRKRGRDRGGRDECLTAPVGGNEGMEKREDGMEARAHRGPMCLSRFYKSIKRGISD